MALIDKITSIANAIRLKRGIITPLSLEDMAFQISLIDGGGGSLPSGIQAIDFGSFDIGSTLQYPETLQKTHNLGVVPDLLMVYTESNIAIAFTDLMLITSPKLAWRSSAYKHHFAYHTNSTTTVSWVNSNTASGGITNLTQNTFTITAHTSSYCLRQGTYKYIAIKFA